MQPLVGCYCKNVLRIYDTCWEKGEAEGDGVDGTEQKLTLKLCELSFRMRF